MYVTTDVLCLCSFVHLLLFMSGADAADFILPKLPETNYTLDDVMVFPRNEETLDVFLMFNDTFISVNLSTEFHVIAPTSDTYLREFPGK